MEEKVITPKKSSRNGHAEKFLQVVEALDKPIAILVTQVDPDAIGAALGLMSIIKSRGAVGNAKIYYCGSIGHPQNLCIFNRYNLKQICKPISEYRPEGEGYVAFVDSSCLNDARLPPDIQSEALRQKVRIVFDHHREEDITETEESFVCVEDVGSTCTLIVEYMQKIGLVLEEEAYDMALLLALGIYTDTKSLISGGKRDREAYGLITKNVTPQDLTQLIRYPLPESHFRNLTYALNHVVRSGSRLVACAGDIKPENGDDLSTIADSLIRMEGVSIVVVWGMVESSIRISARSMDTSTPLDEFLRKCFGDKSGAKLAPDGHGEGGALITPDLSFLMSEKTREKIRDVIQARFAEMVLSE